MLPPALVWLLLGSRGIIGRAALAVQYSCTFLVGLLALDWSLYERVVIPAYEFWYFNLHQNKAADYGVHVWHWYFTVGLPVMLGTYVVPLVLSFVQSGYGNHAGVQ